MIHYICFKARMAVLLLGFSLLFPLFVQAQLIKIDPDDEYTQVLIDRVDNFLSKALDKNDSAEYIPARNIVIKQYIDLRNIHDGRDEEIAAVQQDHSLSGNEREQTIALIALEAERKMYILHSEFLGRLNSELSLEQVEAVKDGITYGTLMFTYDVYLEQNPAMTETDKKFIFGSLYAARELAMDKGSSDEKHFTFGIYKGIINNYLSGITYPDENEYDPAYVQSLADQVDGFLGGIMERKDSSRYYTVQNIIIRQYKDMGNIYEKLKEEIGSGTATSENIELARLEAQKDIYELHAEFKGRLRAELSFADLERVKDGMTNHAFQSNLEAFLGKRLDATDLQKQFVHGAFYAARELAMDKLATEDMNGIFEEYWHLCDDYLAGIHDPNDHLEEAEIPDSTNNPSDEIPLALEDQTNTGMWVYPNPLTDRAVLKVVNQEKTYAIGIFSLHGEELIHISEEELDPGVHYFDMDLTALPKGVYFVRSVLGTKVLNIKIIR